MTSESKTCFVISPIGTDGSDERRRADTVLKHIFKAAIQPLGYEVVRADEISQPGSITMQVLEQVMNSKLVIADLTGSNPNVFYELAVRHASEKPVIHVIDAGQKIPFDIADLRTIYLSLDLDGAQKAREELVNHVRQVEAGHWGETPVKLAGVLKHLEVGKSEDKIILKQIFEGMTELRSEIRDFYALQQAHSAKTADLIRHDLDWQLRNQKDRFVAELRALEAQHTKAAEDDIERNRLGALTEKLVEYMKNGDMSFEDAYSKAMAELPVTPKKKEKRSQ